MHINIVLYFLKKKTIVLYPIVNIIFWVGTKYVLGSKNISCTLIELVTSFSMKRNIYIWIPGLVHDFFFFFR